MTTWEQRTLIEDVVANGVDDWVGVDEIWGNIARRVVEDAFDRRALALGLITVVVLEGLMEAGTTPPNSGGFVPWDCSPAEAVNRIATEWLSLADPDIRPGDICWLRTLSSPSLTVENRIARSVPDVRVANWAGILPTAGRDPAQMARWHDSRPVDAAAAHRTVPTASRSRDERPT
jgi:hypothetical protein